MQPLDANRQVPYALTMVSTFDTAAPGIILDPYGIYQTDARIDLSFVLDGQAYSFHGVGQASVSRAPNDWGYVQDALIPTLSSGPLFFSNVVTPNSGGYSAALLEATSYTTTGWGMVSLWPPYPENQMAGDEERASVLVESKLVSSVPEPAAYGMLLGGMLVLGACRRRRQ
jgi:hypothetical protein